MLVLFELVSIFKHVFNNCDVFIKTINIK